MRMQSSEANCGSTALHNALAAIGTRRSLDECEILCGVKAESGTNPFALIEAIATIRKINPVVLKENDSANIYNLDYHVRRGRSAILLVDDNDHYVAVVGLIGDRILVADSAKNELVLSYTEQQLIKRWAPYYWAIIL